ncbi:hypothetical protein ACHAXM_002898, partial [Skeletonema potamos]
ILGGCCFEKAATKARLCAVFRSQSLLTTLYRRLLFSNTINKLGAIFLLLFC